MTAARKTAKKQMRPRSSSGGAHDQHDIYAELSSTESRAGPKKSRPSYVSLWGSSRGPPATPATPAMGAVGALADHAQQSAVSSAPKLAQQRPALVGPKTRLRLAQEEKKSQTSTTSLSCCCRIISKTSRTKAISLLKHKSPLRSNQMVVRQQQQQHQHQPQQQRPRRRPMLATSGDQNRPSSSQLGPQRPNHHYQPSTLSGHYRPQESRNNDNQMEMIKKVSRELVWNWDETSNCHFASQCQINPHDKSEVCFHPLGSESTAACRGDKPLLRNGNYYYWELTVSEKCYGTSVMFGLCTLRQNLHALDYCNLIGLDQSGWSLSHKGLIWHNGLLLNTMQGELSYFMDGRNLGVAFCGLNDVEDELYPVVGSTAKNTKVRITGSYCGYVSLLERSCFTILKNHSQNKEQLLEYLNRCKLPKNLIDYLSQAAGFCASPTAIKTTKQQQPPPPPASPRMIIA